MVSPILFIITGRFVEFYPLRQFAPVIHGNHQARGRIAMGSPAAKDCCLFFSIRLLRNRSLAGWKTRPTIFMAEGFLPIALRPWRAVFRGSREPVGAKHYPYKTNRWIMLRPYPYIRRSKRVFPPPRKNRLPGKEAARGWVLVYFS